MSILKDKMTAVAADLSQDGGLPPDVVGAGDFLTWLMELMKELIPLIIGCFPSKEKAVAAMNNPNFFQRFRLRQAVRRHMRDVQAETRLLNPLTVSLEKVGKTITKAEWEQIVAE